MRTLLIDYTPKSSESRAGATKTAYLRRMRLIQELLPEARFIHIVRDGRDVALSVKDLWFRANSVEEAALPAV